MAIVNLASGRYRVKLQDDSGNWVNGGTWDTKREAQAADARLKLQKREGTLISATARKITVNEYFCIWFDAVKTDASPGWRKEQLNMYKKYVVSEIGSSKLYKVKTDKVKRVLTKIAEQGKSAQLQLHIYNLLRKMFSDAIEIHQILTLNPVIKKLKPKVEVREVPHLNLRQSVDLLLHVKEKPHGAAIWSQLFLGLRVGEVIALKWEHLDLESGTATIKESYSRKNVWATGDKTRGIKIPKANREEPLPIPPELLEYLLERKLDASTTYVCPSPKKPGEMMSYEYYLETLNGYCLELKLPMIGTHGLRHSTSAIMRSNGATNDLVGQMLRQSSADVTARYTHGDSGLKKTVANIRILPDSKSSINLPRDPVETVDIKKEVN